MADPDIESGPRSAPSSVALRLTGTIAPPPPSETVANEPSPALAGQAEAKGDEDEVPTVTARDAAGDADDGPSENTPEGEDTREAVPQGIRTVADAILQDDDRALSERDVHLGEDEAVTAAALSYPRSPRPPSLPDTTRTTVMARLRTGAWLLGETRRQRQADEAAVAAEAQGPDEPEENVIIF